MNILTTIALASSLVWGGSNGWICDQLDKEPTVTGVLHVAGGLFAEGYDGKQAGKILVTTVQGQCPNHIPLLVKFAEQYGG